MSVTLEKINTRLLGLNSEKRATDNLSNIRLIDESKELFFEKNAVDKIRSWYGLSENIDEAYEIALDTLEFMIENDVSRSTIIDQTRFLITEASKTRSASQLKRSLKYKFSRFKTKLQNDIKKAQKAIAKPKAGVAAFNFSNKIPRDASGKREEAQLELAKLCYSALIENMVDLAECDRIIKNYEMVHSRFNLEKLLTECANGERDIYDTVYTLTARIDTFSNSFTSRFNTALECAWYGLNKKYITCENKDIIEAVIDYYVFNGGLTESDINEINLIKRITPLFEETDFDIINFLQPSDATSIDDMDDCKYDQLHINTDEQINESALDSIVGIQQLNAIAPDGTITKNIAVDNMIATFKNSCAKNSDTTVNYMLLKSMIDELIAKYPAQIPFQISKILQIIRTSFVVTPEDDKARLVGSCILDMVKAIIDIPMSEKYSRQVLEKIEKEIQYVNDRIESIKDNIDAVTSKALDSYFNSLTKAKDKLTEYISANFEPTEEEKAVEDAAEEESPEEDVESNEVSEEELKEAAKIVLISRLVESVAEVTADGDVDEIICGNIAKFSNDTMDDVIDFANTAPDIINKEKLSEALKKYRTELREEGLLVNDNYIRINCVNDNIDKLNESNNIYNSYNSFDTDSIINYLMCIDEINHTNFSNNSLYIMEGMSFVNSLKLALNNLKRKATELHDKEKRACESMDGAINSIINGMNKEMTDADREAIARGSILPSASKCLKYALLFTGAWILQPELAVLGAIGLFFTRKKSTASQRQLALDEIEVELKMCERYLRMYEEQNDMKAVRQCEIIQRNLQRQHQRIKYKMAIDFRHVNTSKLALPSGNGTPSSDY